MESGKKYEEEVEKRYSAVDTGEDQQLRFQKARDFISGLTSSANIVLDKLNAEKDETRKMAETFYRLLSDKLNLDERTDPPSSEEVQVAIEQLKDTGRVAFFASFSILPGGGALLIALELLARRYGIDWFTFVPSSFRKKQTTKKKKK